MEPTIPRPSPLASALLVGIASASVGLFFVLPKTLPAPAVATNSDDATTDGGGRSCRTADDRIALAERPIQTDGGSDRRVVDYNRRACELGSAKGCVRVADAFQGAPRDACVVRYTQRACDLGSMESCSSVAAWYSYGSRGVAKDPARAAQLEEKACNGGILSACDSLAYAYEKGEGVPQSTAREAQLLEKVCQTAIDQESDFSFAGKRTCKRFADNLRLGSGIPKDETRAAKYYEIACDVGEFNACFELGKLLAVGRGVTKDVERAKELIQTACANNFGSGCDDGAAMFKSGRDVPAAPGTAKELTEKSNMWAASACEMHGVNCDSIAITYANPRTEDEWNVAMPRLVLACSRGVAAACRLTAKKYIDPEARKKAIQRADALDDPARVKAMLERECDAWVLGDCYLLGMADREGNPKWNVPKDMTRAQALLTKSCDAEFDNQGAECRMARSFGDINQLADAQAPGDVCDFAVYGVICLVAFVGVLSCRSAPARPTLERLAPFTPDRRKPLGSLLVSPRLPATKVGHFHGSFFSTGRRAPVQVSLSCSAQMRMLDPSSCSPPTLASVPGGVFTWQVSDDPGETTADLS